MSTINDDPVWFITGCSTGLGRAMAQAALDRGYRVVATARRLSDLSGLQAQDPARTLKINLDVTIEVEIEKAISVAKDFFGRIDVLVNNTGFGYFGAIEESDDAAARRMFETNFWGLSGVTRSVLPIMRKQRSGFVINISSIGGLRGSAGVGYYNATKFAVEGWSEALAAETRPLGIRVMLVEPSGFRTDWAGRSAGEAERRIADYAGTAHARWQQIREGSGRQPGDPRRAAAAILDAVNAPEPPMRLLLGAAALKAAREKIQHLTEDLEAWADVAKNADFPTSKS